MNHLRGTALGAHVRRYQTATACRRCASVEACGCGQVEAATVLAAAELLAVPGGTRAEDDGSWRSPAGDRWIGALDRVKGRRLTAAALEGLAREATYLSEAWTAQGEPAHAWACRNVAETARHVAAEAMP